MSPPASSLICRHSAGERILAEEAPPVVSTAHPPRRLLLLAGRHASCAGTVGPLPQRGHQKELHSVNLGAVHGHAGGLYGAEDSGPQKDWQPRGTQGQLTAAAAKQRRSPAVSATLGLVKSEDCRTSAFYLFFSFWRFELEFVAAQLLNLTLFLFSEREVFMYPF